jgi:hypothetical protein
VSGHWEVPASLRRETDPSVVSLEEAEDAAVVRVHTGIALVIPGQHILDVLNREDVAADRAARDVLLRLQGILMRRRFRIGHSGHSRRVETRVPRSRLGSSITMSFVSMIAASCLLFTGCGSDNHPVITIDNQLNSTVKITFLNSLGQEGALVDSLPSHQKVYLDVFPSGLDRCTPGAMIARDVSSGTEVARSPDPVCRPSVWTLASTSGDQFR